MDKESRPRGAVWCLTGRLDEDRPVEVFEITTLPFLIGRRPGLSLTLPARMVSGIHAEITEDDGTLRIRDLQSTNGTYVNGRPVTTSEQIEDGDLIQTANVVLRLSRVVSASDRHTLASREGAHDQALSLAQFDKLLKEHAVVPHYQPIVSLPEGTTVGYETLARSRLFGLHSPKDMFLAASQLDLEAELSRVMRLAGFEEGRRISRSLPLYLNTHPVEIVTFGLLESLQELREIDPVQPVTLEVHEAAVTHLDTMNTLREALESLDMQLAFDDFGAGQSRLIELTKVMPDLVKFDIHMIRNIHRDSPSQQNMLRTLVRMVTDLGITPLAEGVECEGEHAVCCDVGFQLAQGYYYGKPASVADTLDAQEKQRLPV